MTSPRDVAVWVLRHRKGEAAMSVLWLVFAVVFLVFACFHYVESTKSLPPFEVTSRPLQAPESGVRFEIGVAGISLDQPLEDFARDFNAYLDEQNRSSAKANRVAACEFLIAGLTALISVVLEWREDLSRLVRGARKHKGREGLVLIPGGEFLMGSDSEGDHGPCAAPRKAHEQDTPTTTSGESEPGAGAF